MVTAEIAIAIPALLLVVGVVLSAIHWTLDAITASSVTAESARQLSQGNPENEVLSQARRAIPRGVWVTRVTNTETCVAVTLPPPLPLAGPVTVEQCVAN